MGEYIAKHFSCLSEFSDFIADRTPENSCFANDETSNFNGFTTWEAAQDMLSHGHKAGAVKISETVDRLNHRTEQEIKSYSWDVEGLCFDVGAMLTGEPEHWLQPEPEEARRVFKLLVHIGHLGDVSTDVINNRGAAIAALVDSLQQNPANIVELQIVSYAKGVGRNSKDIAIFIDMGVSPIDMDAIGFTMAHAGFFRKMIFAAREKLIGERTHDMGGTAQVLQKHMEPDTIYFAGGSADFLSENDKLYSSLDRAADTINKKIVELTNRSKT